MLRDLTVLEVGDAVASAAAGAMLRRLGARVQVLGDARADGSPASQRQTLIDVLHRGAERIPGASPWASDVIERARAADITIVDSQAAPPMRTTAEIRAYEDRVQRVNANTWVTISPYGLQGPLATYRAGELTSTAAGGIVRYMRSSSGRPMKPAGFTSSITAGHFAALAALHGVLGHREGAGPRHLDLSLQEVVISTGVFLECSHHLFACASEGGSSRYASPRGFVRCGTGLIWILVIENHHWTGLQRALGEPAWAASITTRAQRDEHRDMIDARLAEWAAQFTAQECAAQLQAHGVPATPVNSPADLLAATDLDVRTDFFERSTDDSLPGSPVAFIAREAGGATDMVPGRHRVLELGQALVVPMAAAWLGAIGVDVLKVEDLDRTDMYRRHGPFLHNEPGPEQSAYFSFTNHSKRSYGAQLDTPAGRERLAALVASADVVMANLSAHRAAALGLTPTALHAADGPVLVACAGYGRGTAHAGYKAYGMNIQAAGGIVWVSRDRGGTPVNLGTSWADALTSVWLAATTLAALLNPPARRAHADVSMVEAIAYELPEYFARLTADGIEMVGDESRLDHAAPHGVYRCAGEDRWLALEVETDVEWRQCRIALGDPSALADPGYDTLAGRLASQDELDARLDGVLAAWDAEAAFHALQQAGVACAPVWSAGELLALEQLRSREFFQTVDHPVWGQRALAGLPWRVVGESRRPLVAPPLLGQHTDDDPRRWWRV